jgi:hypothetical protein
MKATVKVAVLLLTLEAAAVARAQSYTLDWFSIDGGGGTSAGGAYSLSGTIGQADSGTVLSGGNYSVAGGFWGMASAATQPVPALAIAPTGPNTVIISWPSPSAGWRLQQNTSLENDDWSEVLMLPNDDGATMSITVGPLAGDRFYRLKRQ